MGLAVGVTGTGGRLGRALVTALGGQGYDVSVWSRPEYDLDDPDGAGAVVRRDHPDVAVHAAAWTDVDGCAREPDRAMRRNAEATKELARECARIGARLVLISTNEVFDGQRSDGLGYAETDLPRPINPYGVSKRAAEEAAAEAFQRAGTPERLSIVRTAWLFGPPGNDFPAKVIAASDRLAPHEPLKVVADEVGSPTYSVDLARVVASLISTDSASGVYHLVNGGQASRLEVARRVLSAYRPGRATAPISLADNKRASTPPAWAVLRSTRAEAMSVALRPWQEALDAYLSSGSALRQAGEELL